MTSNRTANRAPRTGLRPPLLRHGRPAGPRSRTSQSIFLLLGALVFLAVGAGSPALAQFPTANTVLVGYGSMTYAGETSDEFVNDFTASLSPVLLYGMGDDMLFEGELEFGLSGTETTTTLEYAQLDYVGFERVVIVGGKFLLPFGLFGERLHPTWINRLPSSPLTYGHAHGGVAEGSLLPVLSDAGLMLRYKADLGSTWDVVFSGWVSQGPQMVEEGEEGDDHAHAAAGKSGGTSLAYNVANGDGVAPDVGFGIGFADNNKNKMLGGRLGLVRGSAFEAYVSGFTSRYDEGNFLEMSGVNLAAVFRQSGLDFLFEGIALWQEIPHGNDFDTVDKKGLYGQVAWRTGPYEPVARWSQLFESTFEGGVVLEQRRQLALGINYWVSPSVPVKLAYEIEFDGQDRLLVQWAYGF